MIYVAGQGYVTTQDAQHIQKSYNLDAILSQFYGLGSIWEDLRTILGPRDCKRAFQGPFFEDLGSKMDPKWDPWGRKVTTFASKVCLEAVFFLTSFRTPIWHPELPQKCYFFEMSDMVET